MSSKAQEKTNIRVVATNRKARFEYFIEESYEAGIILTGTEIKSVRAGKVNLQDGFVLIRGGEAWLMNVHIGHFVQGNRYNHEETRTRKLLLHKKQIAEIHIAATQKKWTVVPLQMYIDERGRAKLQIALVRGKQLHDKRDTVAKRDSDRELRRAIKGDY
jgi:SsrA-binding protein